MKPIHFKEANHVLTAPTGMTAEQCGDLPVFAYETKEGWPVLLSNWSLSDEDLQRIQEKKSIWLQLVTQNMPPVALFIDSPFEEVAQPSNEVKPNYKFSDEHGRHVTVLQIIGEWCVVQNNTSDRPYILEKEFVQAIFNESKEGE